MTEPAPEPTFNLPQIITNLRPYSDPQMCYGDPHTAAAAIADALLVMGAFDQIVPAVIAQAQAEGDAAREGWKVEYDTLLAERDTLNDEVNRLRPALSKAQYDIALWRRDHVPPPVPDAEPVPIPEGPVLVTNPRGSATKKPVRTTVRG